MVTVQHYTHPRGGSGRHGSTGEAGDRLTTLKHLRKQARGKGRERMLTDTTYASKSNVERRRVGGLEPPKGVEVAQRARSPYYFSW